MTLRQVEGATDVSNAYLSQLENGLVSNPSPNILNNLSEFYDVPYEILLEKAGYLHPKNNNTTFLGKVTKEEEKELLQYLAFMKKKKKV